MNFDQTVKQSTNYSIRNVGRNETKEEKKNATASVMTALRY